MALSEKALLTQNDPCSVKPSHKMMEIWDARRRNTVAFVLVLFIESFFKHFPTNRWTGRLPLYPEEKGICESLQQAEKILARPLNLAAMSDLRSGV